METKEVIFHPKQFNAFNFTTQYAAAIAGVQSGKTFLGAYWSAKQIADCKGNGLICAPTYKILQQSTLPKFFKEFPSYQKYYKEQKGQLVLGDKVVYIRSMDDPYGIEGMTLDWVWGDEAGQFSLMAWIVLRSRTSIAKGQILFTTTPYNLGWLYQDFYKKVGIDKDLSVFTWASIENPYFPKEFFEKEKLRLRQEEFNRRYCGEFTRMEGLVYNLHDWQTIPPKELRSDITIGGIDWGWTNPAAISILKYSDGKWYVVDEWYETHKTTREIIEQAMRFQEKYGVNRWYADSANPEKIKETEGTGLYVQGYVKEKDSLTAGISYIQQELNENRLYVFNTCVNTLSEFGSYIYPEGGKKDEPIPENNHLMDCIRYSIHGYRPARRFAVNPLKKQAKAEREYVKNFDYYRLHK